MTPEETATPPPAPTRRGRTGASRTVSTDPFASDESGTASGATATFDDALVQAGASGPIASRTPAPTAAASTAGVVGAVASAPPVAASTTLPSTRPAPSAGRVAIAWVDEESIAHSAPAVRTLDDAASPYLPVEADLLSDPPRRSLWRAAIVVPLVIIVLLIAGYATTTLLWPLHAVPGRLSRILVESERASGE